MSDAAARLVLDVALGRPPTLGGARLVCLDGPSGAGKTTLAAQVAAARPGTSVVHLDDLYDGWTGLPRVGDRLEELLRPMAGGSDGGFDRWDWAAGARAGRLTVPWSPLVVVEGVGAGSPRVADLVTVLVWVWAPAGLRRTRAVERDGEGLVGHWAPWARSETRVHAREGTALRADVLVDGTGRTGPRRAAGAVPPRAGGPGTR